MLPWGGTNGKFSTLVYLVNTCLPVTLLIIFFNMVIYSQRNIFFIYNKYTILELVYLLASS